MYRVMSAALATIVLVACSSGVQTPPLNYAGAASEQTSSIRTNSPRASQKAAKRIAKLGSATAQSNRRVRLDPLRAAKLINAYRRKNGLKPIKLHSKLTLAAKRHSLDLARTDRISHYGSDGSNPFDRVRRSGYRPRLAAENVGTGQLSLGEVLKSWKASKGHNKNLLLKGVRHMGIALVQDDKTEFKTFWTLVLGAPI